MKAVAWYETWSDYQFHHIDWLIVGEQWPTVVGLAFFTLILVPIRIPSLTLISGICSTLFQCCVVFVESVFLVLILWSIVLLLLFVSGEEVDFDQELKAQGVANVLSSVVGSVHNYLSYSNRYYLLPMGDLVCLSCLVEFISSLLVLQCILLPSQWSRQEISINDCCFDDWFVLHRTADIGLHTEDIGYVSIK